METVVRVHRILKPLKNFEVFTGESADPSEMSRAGLGQLFGVYRNPGDDGVAVSVYADGVYWVEEGKPCDVKFDEIMRVELSDEKESSYLDVELMTGKRMAMPVRGVRRNFHDSLEMLRFLDRVLADRRSAR